MTRSPLEGFIQCTSNLDPDSFIMLSFLSIDFASATGREEGREMEMNSADRASTEGRGGGGSRGAISPARMETTAWMTATATWRMSERFSFPFHPLYLSIYVCVWG